MKKTLLIVAIILIVIIALPLFNFIQWSLQAKMPLDIIIVDKTVPTLEREHHKPFSWILTNERFVKKENGQCYSYKKDYFGFFPLHPVRDKKYEKNDYRLSDVIPLAEKNDVLYVTDTYGVFFNDWYRGINKSRKSRIIYGGLNNNDFLLLKEMKDRNKLIIMEYNSFDYPTAQFESVRTQQKLGISFSGWTGKYFSSLDTGSLDFPIWMTSMYRKQYKAPWKFTKPGIVILKEKDIVVLEEGTQLKSALPTIITDEANSKKYGVIPSVAFDQWFDIIDPLQNQVISKFKIDATSLGNTLLVSNGLQNEFPAVVQDPVTQRLFYFSGDFATYDLPFWIARFKGAEKLKGILYSDKPDDTRRFFWLYYKPLINRILTDYYTSLNKK